MENEAKAINQKLKEAARQKELELQRKKQEAILAIEKKKQEA